MCNKNKISTIINKEDRQLKGFYVCMLHTAASVAVTKLVVYIQAMLCPKAYDMLV